MRLVVDSVIGLMMVGILAGVLLYHRQASSEIDQVRFVHDSLSRLHEAAVLHRVLAGEGDARAAYPRIVRPDWFGDAMPVNLLLDRDRPWIDLAPPGDHATHPPDPIADHSTQAGFWYNPNTGIFRARVQRQVTERDTLDLYNRINGSALSSAIADANPARTPTPLVTTDLTTAMASPRDRAQTQTTTTATPAKPSVIDLFADDEVQTLDLSQPPGPTSLFDNDPATVRVEDASQIKPQEPKQRRSLRDH